MPLMFENRPQRPNFEEKAPKKERPERIAVPSDGHLRGFDINSLSSSIDNENLNQKEVEGMDFDLFSSGKIDDSDVYKWLKNDDVGEEEMRPRKIRPRRSIEFGKKLVPCLDPSDGFEYVCSK